MKSRRFSSFEEIDTELEILSISRRLNVYRIKNLTHEAGGESLRTGILRAVTPLLRTWAISLAVKALKKRFS
jgi:hypothetical protein